MAAGDKTTNVTWPQVMSGVVLIGGLISVTGYVFKVDAKADLVQQQVTTNAAKVLEVDGKSAERDVRQEREITDLKSEVHDTKAEVKVQGDTINSIRSDVRLIAEWVTEQKRAKDAKP